MFLRKAWLSPNYKALQPRKPYSSAQTVPAAVQQGTTGPISVAAARTLHRAFSLQDKHCNSAWKHPWWANAAQREAPYL
jgi:hypothetical protein